jgi:hypothetical protein
MEEFRQCIFVAKCLVFLMIVAMWLFYAFLLCVANPLNVPIWTVGGILMLLGFIALAIIFAIITIALFSAIWD